MCCQVWQRIMLCTQCLQLRRHHVSWQSSVERCKVVLCGLRVVMVHQIACVFWNHGTKEDAHVDAAGANQCRIQQVRVIAAAQLRGSHRANTGNLTIACNVTGSLTSSMTAVLTAAVHCTADLAQVQGMWLQGRTKLVACKGCTRCHDHNAAGAVHHPIEHIQNSCKIEPVLWCGAIYPLVAFLLLLLAWLYCVVLVWCLLRLRLQSVM